MGKAFYEVDGKEYCDEALALSEMLAESSLLFVGGAAGPFFEAKEGDGDEPATIHINCNDLFAWGCADEMPLPADKIGEFYKAWKSGNWGTTRWCCKRANLQPQPPIRERMKTEGAWDDEMAALPKNSG